MSLTALIYNHQNTIVSLRDLQNVMNSGNELYTSLSRLSISPKIFIISATQLRFLNRLVDDMVMTPCMIWKLLAAALSRRKRCTSFTDMT